MRVQSFVRFSEALNSFEQIEFDGKYFNIIRKIFYDDMYSPKTVMKVIVIANAKLEILSEILVDIHPINYSYNKAVGGHEFPSCFLFEKSIFFTKRLHFEENRVHHMYRLNL